MVKKIKTGTRDQSGMDVYVFDQIVWTQQSSDPQVDAAYTTATLDAFTGSNLDAVNTLNREFDRRKQEITQLKE